MRLSTLAVIGAAAYLSAVPALALGLQDVYGVWRHPDNGSLIQVYRCGGGICAKVVSVLDPNRTDVKNPDPALRGRPIVGIEIWRHAKETAPLQWSGSAYNPLDGATLYGTLHLTSETTLVVASCNLNVMPCFEHTRWFCNPRRISHKLTSPRKHLRWKRRLWRNLSSLR